MPDVEARVVVRNTQTGQTYIGAWYPCALAENALKINRLTWRRWPEWEHLLEEKAHA